MAGFAAQGATFTFRGVQATVVSLDVQTPTAEVVDMTAYDAPADAVVLVPTGAWSGGSVSVEYIYRQGGVDPQTVVRQYGPLVFSSAGVKVSRQAILESASTQIRTGDLVKGTLNFRLTDYY